MLLEQVRDSIRALKPVDPEQQALQNGAVGIHVNLLRQRWLLIEQQGPSVQRLVLVVLVSWVTVISVSFGLNAPRNGTVVVAFLICSLAIGASIVMTRFCRSWHSAGC
jgi:lipopolysaccharide export LptBFGC system permease protein LptF